MNGHGGEQRLPAPFFEPELDDVDALPPPVHPPKIIGGSEADSIPSEKKAVVNGGSSGPHKRSARSGVDFPRLSALYDDIPHPDLRSRTFDVQNGHIAMSSVDSAGLTGETEDFESMSDSPGLSV